MEYGNDPDLAKRIQEDQTQMEMELEKREVTESREEIKRIWMEKIKAEGKLQVELVSMQMPN